jgi:corrinoid protein of di/trimethylamine methyltransferase
MGVDELETMKNLVIEGDKEGLAAAVQSALDAGTDAVTIVDEALTPGMQEVGERFERMELFLPEMILSADAMKGAVEILQPALKSSAGGERPHKGIVILGTIQHDVHDIGKTIVASYLEVNGFEVHDLGRDVAAKAFVEKAIEVNADVIGVSALMTSTMQGMVDVVDEAVKAGIREKCAVIVGGAPITEAWAHHIGADGSAEDAVGAARLAEAMVNEVRGIAARQA